MKAKGLKLSAIIFAIGAMLLALVGIYTPSASVMASSSSSQNSSWMKTENGYEKTANTAGSTSGYDKYILGEKNVTLSTQANEGYDLLAWLVLDSSNNKVAELTPTSKTGTVTVDGVDANLTATFEDVDEDGLFDNGEFTISQVLKELRVEPIFGYTYYTLDVTSFAPISNIASEKLIINPAVYVYDESNASLTVETLQNMFVVKGESTSGGFEIKEAYYFETIYKEQGSDAYFVVQNGERVDCLQGAYTLGQQIDIETGVSAGTLMQGVGVTLVTNTTSKLVQNTEIKVVNAENAIVNNSVYFEKDAKNLTTKIAGKFVIAKAYDRINKLELNYHKVYKVELKVNLEGSEASGAILTDLLSVIKVENYVAKETDALIYYVKENKNNAFNVAFTIGASNYQKTINGRPYAYYNLQSIAGDTTTETKAFNYDKESNRYSTINVDYVLAEYKVSFIFGLAENGSITTNLKDSFNVADPVFVKKGQTKTLTEAENVANNTGYKFVGFATSVADNVGSLTTTKDVEINDVTPKDIIIIAVYEKINYTIVINNYNQISLKDLSDQPETIFPGVQLTLNKKETLIDLDADNTFDITVSMGDKIELTSTITDGFVLEGIYFDAELNLKVSDSFELSKDIIESYADGNLLNLYLKEVYKEYTLIYYIEKAPNGLTDEHENPVEEIMANISAETTKGTVSPDVSDTDADGKIEIKFVGLHKFDQVALRATGKEFDTTNHVAYKFIMFTEDGLSRLAPVDEDAGTVEYTADIFANRTIKVVYSTPKVMMSISTNEGGSKGFILTEISLTQVRDVADGGNVDLGAKQDYEINIGNYELSLVDAIKYGYYIESVTIKAAGMASGTTLTDTTEYPGIYSITISSAVDHEVVITIKKYAYTVNVYESFDDGVSYGQTPKVVNIDIESGALTFAKPEGYYVTNFLIKVKEESTMFDYSSIASAILENNDKITEYYLYNFAGATDSEPSELEKMLSTYAIINDSAKTGVLNVYVAYELHTLTVRIEKVVANGYGDTRDNAVRFPIFTLNDENGNLLYTTKVTDYDGRFVTLRNLPYGQTAIIATDWAGANFGLEVVGWRLGNDSALTSTNYLVIDGELKLTGIKENQELDYKIQFVDYDITATVEDTAFGEPRITVNGQNGAEKVKLLSTIEIDSAAKAENGYKFASFVMYTVEEYTGYNALDTSNWEANWNSLYVRANGIYVLNTSKTYDSNKTYYSKVENVYTESRRLEIDTFNPETIFVDEHGLTIEVGYKLREIVIENKSENANDVLNAFNNSNYITTNDYATYTIKVLDLQGNVDPKYAETGKVTANNNVEITIQINKVTIKGVEYDLTQGLSLQTYREDAFNNITVAKDENGNDIVGKYVLVFNMKSIFASNTNIIDNGEYETLKIAYKYVTEARTVVVSTNVVDSHTGEISEISEFVSSVKFNIDKGMFGDAITETNSSTGLATRSAHFLEETRIAYTFSNNYGTYIRFYTVQIIDLDKNTTISAEEAGVKIEKNGNVINAISVRYLKNIKIRFIATPVIYLNGIELTAEDRTVTTEFMCDNFGNAKPQPIVVGTEVTSADAIEEHLVVTHYKENGQEISSPKNAGVYKIEIGFDSTAPAWMKNLKVACNVTYIINKMQIVVGYQNGKLEKMVKTYDGSSDVLLQGKNKIETLNELLRILEFRGTTFTLTYKQALESQTPSFVLDLITSGIRAFISYEENGKQIEVSKANDKMYYNITIENLKLLEDSEFNNNFVLINENAQVKLPACIQITRKQIQVEGIIINDKVFDGTTVATMSEASELKLFGVVGDDKVEIAKENIVMNFADAKIGSGKIVTVDYSSALIGEEQDADNYEVKRVVVQGKVIYPYELKVEIPSIGSIHVYNNIGLENAEKANLIPLNASLNPVVIEPDSSEFAEIYSSVSQYLSRRNVFAIGFRLNFELEDGSHAPISKDLTLAVPAIEELTDVICLNGGIATKVDYEVKEGVVYLNLSGLETDVRDILLTERRALLPLWAIILIVVASVAAVAGGVTAFIIIRKKKAKGYNKHDKI